MGRSLFVDWVDDGGKRGGRRSWTMPVSLGVHAAVAAALLTMPRPTASEPEPEPPPIGPIDMAAVVQTPPPVKVVVRNAPTAAPAAPRRAVEAPPAPGPRAVVGISHETPSTLPGDEPQDAPPPDARLCVGCPSTDGVLGGGSDTGPADATGSNGDGSGGPLRIGGDILPPVKIRDVAPVYPVFPLRAGIGGDVVLECTIDPSGAVVDIRVVSGNQLFVPAAREAVRQWRYRPTHLNGHPVAVLMTVTVRFIPKR